MLVVHNFKGNEIKKRVNENIGFLIGNKNGSYFSLSNDLASRYEGAFFYEKSKLCRTIANINSKGKVTKVINKFSCIERYKGNKKETFFMPSNYNSLVYEGSNEIELWLDNRESYDSDNFQRFYNISSDKNKIIIEYVKQDRGEINYLVIRSNKLNFNKIEKWIPNHYSWDEKRNSKPFDWYVFNALTLKAKTIVFSFSHDEEKAINEADYVFKNLKKLKTKKNKEIEFLYNITKKIKNKKLRFAYLSTLNSLDILTNPEGIFAGFPWFFQYWTRDELISLKACLHLKHYELILKILRRDLNNIMESGILPNRFPEHDLNNADSNGWLCFRILELIKEGRLDKKFDNLTQKLEEMVNRLLKNKTVDGLAKNEAMETWMDTSFKSKSRDGFRIEIQALRLSIYNSLYHLTNNQFYKKLEEDLKNKVLKEFWNNEILADGVGDFTIRPNLFIAFYVYPKLLDYIDWVKCFDNILPKLWCEWGGLSSIDKNHELFCGNSTGDSLLANYDKSIDYKKISYHNGDSWFFVNNMAALSLHRLDKRKYNHFIKKIAEASSNEILWHGKVGHHSEISSANVLESLGCWSQAWSNAMFIELIEETYLDI